MPRAHAHRTKPSLRFHEAACLLPLHFSILLPARAEPPKDLGQSTAALSLRGLTEPVRANNPAIKAARSKWEALNLRNTLRRVLALAAFLALAVWLAGCSKTGSASKPADVDYYTCTMHPR